MTKDRYFSDEELVAYLDGEEEFAPIQEISTALEHDAMLASRIEDLRLDTSLVAKSFDALKPSNLKPPALPPAPRSKAPYLQIAAAAAVALMVGFGVGFSTSSPPQSDWRTYVAAYQALYTNSTLAKVDQPKVSMRAELNRATSAIGKTMMVEDLTISSEISYKRAQILGYKGKALVQLAFLSSTGVPVALCIIRTQKSDSQGVNPKKMEDMSSASWSQNGYEYLLIGGTDQPLITRLASQFKTAEL